MTAWPYINIIPEKFENEEDPIIVLVCVCLSNQCVVTLT